MAKLRSINEVKDSIWSGSDILGALTQRTRVFIFSYSPRFKSLFSWSDNALEVLGVEDKNIARDGNLFLRHVHPDDRFVLMTELESALSGGKQYRASYRWIRPDTEELRWLHCRGSLVERNEETFFEGFILDVSEEYTGPVRQFAGPDSVQTVLAAFTTLAVILNDRFHILRINHAPSNTSFNFGDESFCQENFRIGKPFLTCFADKEIREQYRREFSKLLEGNASHYCTRFTSEDYVYNLEVTPIIENNLVSGLLMNLSNVTAMVSLESKLAELQKTEGLRLIASGVAHNFNNVLQTITGQAAVIQSHSGDEALVKQASQAIMEAVNRSSALTQQLYQLDTTHSDILTPVDLNLAVMAAVNRIDDLFTTGTKVAVAFGNPPPVLARQEELIEAVEKILRTAKESLDKDGNISIKTFETSLQDLEIDDLKAGKYAKLTISDTGPGMTKEELRRCTEPFYTSNPNSKDPQEVTPESRDLTLSNAFGTIRGFNGTLCLESTLGFGTSISIVLPLSEQPGVLTKSLEEDSTSSIGPEILVVDDDLMVLETMRTILNDLGSYCIVTDDGATALSLFKEHRRTLRLVLLDAVMPGMSGSSLLKRMRRLDSKIPIYGFSGAPPEVTQPMLDAGANAILCKPVNLQELKELVNSVPPSSPKNLGPKDVAA